jgi:hypothetical protein
VTAVLVKVANIRRPGRGRRSASILATVVVLVCVLAGCGTPTQTAPPAAPSSAAAPSSPAAATTAAAPAACADVAELKASLEALAKVKPAEDGVAALKTAIDNVKSNLGPAVASASEMLKPKVEQVQTAFAELQTAADGLTADNFRQKAPSIRAAMMQLRTATADLTSALTQSCPG